MKKVLILLAIVFCCSIPAQSQELVNFTRQQPIISPDIQGQQITFRLRAPKAYEVRLYGSWMPGYGDTAPMARDTAGVWSVTLPLPSPEIYTYNFVVDGVSVNDPANVLMQRDGTRYLSMLLIDGELTENYKEAEHRGNITQVWYNSATIGMERRMFVYTPYGYEANTKTKYPVLYLLHGAGGDEDAWSSMGRTRQIMDNLIEKGLAKPMIVVMPNGNPTQQAARTLDLPEKSFPRNDPAFANIYVKSIVQDIVPYIEKNFRAIAKPESRAIAGLSMGAGHTISATQMFPGTFKYICPLSNGVAENQEGINEGLQGIKKAGYKLYFLACGSSDFLYERACSLDKLLTNNGLEHTFYVTDGGHTWANWRKYLNAFGPLLFK